jgi:branched-chain amino acid transport system ATP-binding protein
MTLQVRGLRAGFGTAPVLTNLDLEVATGEVVGIVGGNGSGKSTLLAALSGLLRPQGGSISLNGRRVDGLAAEQVAAAGMRMLSQQRRVFPGLTVRENLLTPGLAVGRPDAARVTAAAEAWLERFPALGERSGLPASALSGGQQQLLAIGRLLALPSTVLLLDEPSAGLSHEAADEVSGLFAEQAAAGVGLVLVEQDLRFVGGLASRMLHLRGGVLV